MLGAAGGVGMAAVQIGKVLGARVIAAVSSEEKAAFVTSLGADDFIRYDRTPLSSGYRRGDQRRGSRCRIRSGWWRNHRIGAPLHQMGRPGAGDRVRRRFDTGDPTQSATSERKLGWSACFGGGSPTKNQRDMPRTQRTLVRWVAEGKLEPSIQRSFTLEQGSEALGWVADRKAIGRVVIVP